MKGDMQMNTRDLAYFAALTRLKSYTAVAHEFHVSQPTITYAVRRLEAELDVQLIQRDQSHRQLELTAAGAQFAVHCQRIITELQIVQREIAALKTPQIKMGLPPIIGNYFFPHLAPKLVAENLLSRLQLDESGSARLLKSLEAGALDLAMLGSLEPLTAPDLDAALLATHHYRILVSHDHPLAKKKEVAFKELQDEPFLLLNEGFMHPQAFQTLCNLNHIQPHIMLQTSDIDLIKQLVSQNAGISFLTETALTPHDDLVALPLSDPEQPLFLISIAKRHDHLLTPEQKKLAALFKDSF
ncbi:malolactic fermentation transcriptional regulator [Lactobacillus selangorensis]|nr:malolactic fermentation transcriptional regulator [Lactobacillus selangorensis]